MKIREIKQTYSLRFFSRQLDAVYIITCIIKNSETFYNQGDHTDGRWLASYHCIPALPAFHSDGTTIDQSSSCSYHEPADNSMGLRYSFNSPQDFKQWVNDNAKKIENNCLLWDSNID